jgi:hypothetical protein
VKLMGWPWLDSSGYGYEQKLSGRLRRPGSTQLRGALEVNFHTSTRIEEANVKGSAVALVASGILVVLLIFG